MLGQRLDDLLGRGRHQVHAVPGGPVLLDEIEGLGIDDGLHRLLERLAHDLADQGLVPPLGQGQHGLPDPGQLLLARPEVEIDQLGHEGSDDQPAVDEAPPVEGPTEGGDGSLGDDRLVQGEEGGLGAGLRLRNAPAPDFGELGQDVRQEGRLVAPSAHGNRRQIGAVGLQDADDERS